MQLYLDTITSLSSFAVNLILPVSVVLLIVGSAVSNKGLLRKSFFLGIASSILYALIISLELKKASDSGVNLVQIFTTTQGILGLVFGAIVPILVGAAAAFLSSRRYKTIA